MSWEEVVGLADVVLGTFWTNPIPDIYAHAIFLRQVFLDFERTNTNDNYVNARYRSLVFLAWLLEGWPDSYNVGISKDLLKQWSEAKPTRLSRHLGDKWEDAGDPGPHQIEPAIQARIHQLVDR